MSHESYWHLNFIVAKVVSIDGGPERWVFFRFLARRWNPNGQGRWLYANPRHVSLGRRPSGNWDPRR